ncbi:uncharacterized protein LOC111711889 [Eurytemora carolleeae]|uniref:uncharacterized protein LOC111711889 n=1 Tax=Eurytemora carolleeae TaxID=1294199 RepID=UPI000C788B4B|nr:uncharacterized protein LOC111711889 [Eurytemora carolleeae]|eukprot:XP_023342114.1 uncharacterized protein LOC111711889 [Eurytemora affinis]
MFNKHLFIFSILLCLSVSVVSGVISRGFKKTVLPVSSVELQKVADLTPKSKTDCLFACMSAMVRGVDCDVFTFENTTSTCYTGVQKQIEIRELKKALQTEKSMELFVAHFENDCKVLDDPANGRFNCYMGRNPERCFLVCNPGFVPKKYRGVYCQVFGNSARWNVTSEELICLPTTKIAILGGWFDNLGSVKTLKVLDVADTKNLVMTVSSTTKTFTETKLEYVMGSIVTICGLNMEMEMYTYVNPDFILSETLEKSWSNLTSSVIVHDRLYLTDHRDGSSIYFKENLPGIPFQGPTFQVDGGHTCVVRHGDKYFLLVSETSVRLYDIITDTVTELPPVPVASPRWGFSCTTFMNTTSGEEQVLVTGGYSYDEATQTRIYRGFYMKI